MRITQQEGDPVKIVMFYHSLLSDWNHGNAHFLRGVASELTSRGHHVEVYEPDDAWSLKNLVAEHGREPLDRFHAAYPGLSSTRYDLHDLDLGKALDGVDLVIVHEWNEPNLIRRIGTHRRLSGEYRLLFHDTHHRRVTDAETADCDLINYDGVLASGSVIRDHFLSRGWAGKVWTWHEAADTRIFRPLQRGKYDGDVVWIGNWGDGERAVELREFLLKPVKALNARVRAHGVRYPSDALEALTKAGINYMGWLPNFDVPGVFARFRTTVNVPRGPHAQALPGIPAIRVFEALACGIPLVSAPWDDVENLFSPGEDFLVACDSREMRSYLRDLILDEDAARRLAEHGLRTVLSRHTCAHRVDELLDIHSSLETCCN